MKNLYHGSIEVFEDINPKKGKGYKDFGKGFYATAIPSHAERLALRNKKIAIRRQEFFKRKNVALKANLVVAYRYNLIYSENTVGLLVKIFKKADIEWLKFIMKNRKCDGSAHEYDIVIGPTADAETTMIINQYQEELEESDYNDALCQKIISELKPENLPKQYFFGTEKAIKTLRFNIPKRQVIS